MATSRNDRADDDDAEARLSELRTQVELLSEENERLRASYVRAKQTQYRRTALGLLAVGALAAVGGLFVPTASTVLFALGGTGLFAGLLTYYLTPERFITADVGRDVFATLSANEAALAAELGLADSRVYVPVSAGSDPVRLFVPHTETYTLPEGTALAEQTVIASEPETRGLALTPSGARLFDAFETTLQGSLAEAPPALATQLCAALVEQFELLDSADPDTDPEGGRCSVALSGSAYGSPDQFDHPAVSLLATGFAVGLDAPVTTEVTVGDDTVVTLRWDVE